MPDEQTLGVILASFDFADEIRRHRLWFAAGAEWADVTGDKEKELILCGQWMEPVIYSYNKKENKLEEQSNTGLQDLKGWWQSVKTVDINGDGKLDMVLGNTGENFYLRPSKDQPVKLWLNDYDKSGTQDQFLTRTVEGKDMPVFLKHEMEFQMPILKKQNLKHGEFAKKTIQDLLPAAMLKTSQVKKFNYCASVVAINQGNGQFIIHKLPAMVQLSSVNAIRLLDVNNDHARMYQTRREKS